MKRNEKLDVDTCCKGIESDERRIAMAESTRIAVVISSVG